jgi:hypothetical protein
LDHLEGQDTPFDEQGGGGPPGGIVVQEGEYFEGDDLEIDAKEIEKFDTSNGDIDIFIDGDMETAGGAQDDIPVTGNGEVNIYIDGESDMSGQASMGSEDQTDSLTVYSTGVSRVTGFSGVLYADGVDIAGQGGAGGTYGAIISTDFVEMSGNAWVEHDPSLGNTVVDEIESDNLSISYLHVTENKLDIE